MWTGRAEVITVLGVCGAALVIRVVAFLLTIDTTGDGPMRAMQAYAWSRRPRFVISGDVWLPGAVYWAGICTFFFPNPLIGPRLVNLTLGTLTVPVLYVLIRRLYGVAAALLGAVTLAVFPLHVGLSVSSMSEPCFLFFILAALVCLAETVRERDVRILPLGLFLLFYVAAEMTRYEAWPLIPLALGYLYWQSRSASTVVFTAAILLMFPMGWAMASLKYFGNPFYGLLLGIHPLDSGGPVSVWAALVKIVRVGGINTGGLLVVAMFWGAIAELARAMRGGVSVERTAYVIFVGIYWIFIVAGARSVGPALYGRNLLSGLVFALPLAALPFLGYWGRYRHRMAIVVLASIGSVLLAYVTFHPHIWVTRTKPVQIEELARWLRSSPYRDQGILLTKMDWASSYLPLYMPELSGRNVVVSVWVDDRTLRRFVAERKPALLITQPEDTKDRSRVEGILGHPIPAERRVYAAGRVEAYDLSN